MSKHVFTTKSELRLDILERLIDVMSNDITTLQKRVSELENQSSKVDCYYYVVAGHQTSLAYKTKREALNAKGNAPMFKVKVVDE